jgi:polyisoprenoid-binding protein YceI
MKLKLLAAALLAASSFAVQAEPITYTIDPAHAQVEFTYSHFGFSNITGRFDKISGKLTYDPSEPSASSIEVTVDVDSVSTGVEKLDEHLKGTDFFDVAKYPTATFKSTGVTITGVGALKLTGDLTIHGKTLPATFEVQRNSLGRHPMRGIPAIGFDAAGTINRAAYGIDKYLQVTGPEVKLQITAEALVLGQ